MIINNLSHTFHGPLRSKKLRKKMIIEQIKNNNIQLSFHPQLLIKYIENDDLEKACKICTDIQMSNKIKMLKINNTEECHKCNRSKD
jgi:hypothetical protein